MMMIEDAMDRIAHTLNIDPVMVNWYYCLSQII